MTRQVTAVLSRPRGASSDCSPGPSSASTAPVAGAQTSMRAVPPAITCRSSKIGSVVRSIATGRSGWHSTATAPPGQTLGRTSTEASPDHTVTINADPPARGVAPDVMGDRFGELAVAAGAGAAKRAGESTAAILDAARVAPVLDRQTPTRTSAARASN